MLELRSGAKIEWKDDGKIHCHHCRTKKDPKGGLMCYVCTKLYCETDLKKYDLYASSSSGWTCYFCKGECGCSECRPRPGSRQKRNRKPKSQRSLLLEKIKSLKQELVDKENEEIEARVEHLSHDSMDMCVDQSLHPRPVSYPTPAESTGRGIDPFDSIYAILEKILVMIRVRPFTERELASRPRELASRPAFKCDGKSIVLSSQTQTQTGTRYTFDKVFDESCENIRIYEGVRDVVHSALKGINATIIAYGQVGSGKTCTISGIIELLIDDIFAYMQKSGSTFVIKFSALEIYNDHVLDLTCDSSSLRILDHPKKDMVIEGLAETVVKDGQHLRKLIKDCAVKRKKGVTTLNDCSSRSHQIIKLTIESSNRDTSGVVRSLFANLSLVDLAGIESDNAYDTRSREVGSINKSLLALSSVIVSLSLGKKGDYIPYRDCKLTRVLQSALGGNSHTALICTLNPALSQVSQSHNTLKFAKNVANCARGVAFDKQLLDYLRNELLNQKKRNQIETELLTRLSEMERKLSAIKRERDSALSELEELRQQHKKQKGSHN